ncbi:MAG: hypothetical protein IPN49_10075 [Saprospiraceae bacterium]|nr:hypothetical protein [Saprospiraceae bacterium]
MCNVYPPDYKKIAGIMSKMIKANDNSSFLLLSGNCESPRSSNIAPFLYLPKSDPRYY